MIRSLLYHITGVMLSLLLVFAGSVQGMPHQQDLQKLTFIEQQNEAHPSLKKEVSADLEGKSVHEALDRLAEESGLNLNYNPEQLDGSETIAGDLRGETVEDALVNLLADHNMKFVVSESGHLLVATEEQLGLQTGTVAGTVIDGQTDEPLTGANVFIQELDMGAAVDIDGNFEIPNVPVGTHTLVINFVGYQSVEREVTVDDDEVTEISVSLAPDRVGLDEVVVTGTGGEVERRSLGNTVGRVDFDEGFEGVGDIQSALEGQEAGMNVQVNSGAINQQARIRIRGNASISMSNQPLIYVDGVRLSSQGGWAPGVSAGGIASPSGLNRLNFDAIERVEVLKGPAAATLYGSQANAGVIQIFTRDSPEESAPEFTVNYSTTAHQMPNRFKSNAGFVQTEAAQQRVNDVLGVEPDLYEPFESPIQLIDLYDTGIGHQVSASVRGGGGGATYYANVQYEDTDGPWNPTPASFNDGEVGTTNDRNQMFNWTGNLQLLPGDDYRVNLQTDFSHNTTEQYRQGITIYTPTSTARYSNPANAGIASDHDTFGLPFFATAREGTFPQLLDEVNRGKVVLKADWLPSDDLNMDVQVGYDFSGQRGEQYNPFGWNVDGVGPTGEGALTIGTQSQEILSFESKLNWSFDPAPGFESNFVAGFQAYDETAKGSVSDGTEFPGPGLRTVGATNIQSAWSSFSEVVDAGFFVQEQIGYVRSLYVTIGARFDASSAFGEDFNYATYPKASLSYLPLDLHDIDVPGVSEFQLRAAWGQSGQQPGAFDRLATFNPVNSPFGTGIRTGNLGNPELRPEVATEWEVGFELGLMDDRVGISSTYWDRITEDAMLDRSYAPSGGFQQSQLTNMGELAARGAEASVNADLIQHQDFSVRVDGNIAYLWERIESLGDSPDLKVDPGYVRGRAWHREGYAPGAFYGADYAEGVDFPLDLEGDAQQSSQDAIHDFFAQPRDPDDLVDHMMVAGPDGEPLPGGQTYKGHYLGKPNPDFEGSVGTNVRYGNWSLNTRFQFAFGNYYQHNLTDAFRRQNGGIGRNIMKAAELESKMINPDSSPEERADAAQTWMTEMLALTPYDGLGEIEEADYIRWSSLALTYTIPEGLVEQLSLNSARVTLRGGNLALWSKYGGVDPTAAGNDGTEGFVQRDTYGTPRLRTFTATVNLSF